MIILNFSDFEKSILNYLKATYIYFMRKVDKLSIIKEAEPTLIRYNKIQKICMKRLALRYDNSFVFV